ncbi:MAG: iron-containing alcohol dehydrogenase [Christensenellaceae bacterium]|nr:iron-containing alcohol dehydrogenase [Christensenellaceae bacterium]
MFFIKSIFYRIVQIAFRLAMPILSYRQPKIINSISQLGDVFKREKITSLLVVTDKGIVNNGLIAPLEKVLNDNGVAFTLYDKTQPNPTVNNVEEALSLYKQNKCNGLIAIGGGSSMPIASTWMRRASSTSPPMSCCPPSSSTASAPAPSPPRRWGKSSPPPP